MKDDWAQLAAYAVIIIIIGAVSIVKRVMEAKRQRQLRQKEADHRPTVRAEESRGLQTETEPTPPPVRTPVEAGGPETPPEPEPTEVEPADLEEVLRHALGFPGKKPRETATEGRPVRVPRPKGVPSEGPPAPREMEEPMIPAQPAWTEAELTYETKAEPMHVSLPAGEEGKSGWTEFMDDLTEEQPSALARAIILTEVIAQPVALRPRRPLRYRLS